MSKLKKITNIFSQEFIVEKLAELTTEEAELNKEALAKITTDTEREQLLVEMGKASAEKFVKIFKDLFSNALEDEIKWGQVNEKWLEKYKTKELVDLVERRIDNIDNKNDVDQSQLNVILESVSLLYKRQREAEFLEGKELDDPEKIDSILFPNKKLDKPFGKRPFNIESWDELHIQVKQENYRTIKFHKVLNGNPMKDSESVVNTQEDLHLGDKTAEIVSMFCYPDAIPVDRKIISYINKCLKKYWDLEDNPIKRVKGKKQHYIASFKVTTIDKNGVPIQFSNDLY